MQDIKSYEIKIVKIGYLDKECTSCLKRQSIGEIIEVRFNSLIINLCNDCAIDLSFAIQELV